MRLKAAMIAALSYHPALLVLDEPFSGLDVSIREELTEGMLELAEQAGWTLFLSSHDLEDIENLVDYVGFIDKGKLLFSEDLEQLNKRFREVEITVPARRAFRQPGRKTGSCLKLPETSSVTSTAGTAKVKARRKPGRPSPSGTPIPVAYVFALHIHHACMQSEGFCGRRRLIWPSFCILSKRTCALCGSC